MYIFKRKVTYSEISADKKVNEAQIVRYFQDCSTFQSEEIGLGLEALAKKKHGWVLTSWQVIIEDYPVLGDEVITGTWASGFDSMFGFRNFILESPEGKRYAQANSIWVLVDIESGHPSRLTQEDVDGYEVEPPLEMETASRRIRLPKEWVEATPFNVRKADLDTNLHVNNTKYVEMALEYIPDDFKIKQLRVEYRKSALKQDIIYPKINIEESKIIVTLCDSQGAVFVAVEVICR